MGTDNFKGILSGEDLLLLKQNFFSGDPTLKSILKGTNKVCLWEKHTTGVTYHFIAENLVTFDKNGVKYIVIERELPDSKKGITKIGTDGAARAEFLSFQTLYNNDQQLNADMAKIYDYCKDHNIEIYTWSSGAFERIEGYLRRNNMLSDNNRSWFLEHLTNPNAPFESESERVIYNNMADYLLKEGYGIDTEIRKQIDELAKNGKVLETAGQNHYNMVNDRDDGNTPTTSIAIKNKTIEPFSDFFGLILCAGKDGSMEWSTYL